MQLDYVLSVRGIDLILEEGMNVKVCTDGEDPTVLLRRRLMMI
jgi:hypothetical protein